MFLRNAWYTALWSNELRDNPVAKILLNEKIVLSSAASPAMLGPWRIAAATALHRYRSVRFQANIWPAAITA
jgi:hypothetical protein